MAEAVIDRLEALIAELAKSLEVQKANEHLTDDDERRRDGRIRITPARTAFRRCGVRG
jgi:hypothetical protein